MRERGQGDLNITNAKENHAEFLFPLTDYEYDIIAERFGEYCVIISAKELEAGIDSYCKYIGCDFIFEKVEYCNQNRIEGIQVFNTSTKERFLYKNVDFDYQWEYRLAIGKGITLYI